MYTECPDCKTAFRLTADVLRKAQGRVRCGGCGTTFNSLDHLSEGPPGDDPSHTQTARAFDEQSRALLKSLDDYAGRDPVRIEDTGVEWRVLDIDDGSDNDASPSAPEDDEDSGEDAAAATATGFNWVIEDPDADVAAVPANESADDDTISAALDSDDDAGNGDTEVDPEPPAESADEADEDEAGNQASLDLPGGDAADEPMRFDDHTPLPDDFYRPSEQPGFRDADGAADDLADDEAAVEVDESQFDLRLDDGEGDDDWQELLSEVGDDGSEPAADAEDGTPPVAAGDEPAHAAADSDEEALEAEDDALATTVAGTNVDDAADDDDDASVEPQPEAPLPEATAAATDAGSDEPDDDAADAPVDDGEEDELARSMAMEIDTELMRAAADGDPDPREDAARRADDNRLVETIIMEGDTVTDLLVEAEQAMLEGEPPPDEDEDEDAAAAAVAGSRRRRGFAIAAIVLLGIALAAQLVHANRGKLATWSGFGSTVGPVYEALGSEVLPAWNIRGWQFESTSGSTDARDERLTINSRIANRSDAPLPYPLVHVALTDRFEEVVGSRILEASEYLAGNGSPGRPVAPGASFTAVITVDAPSPEATGFKLNVCYPAGGGQVRCAIDDFRD